MHIHNNRKQVLHCNSKNQATSRPLGASWGEWRQLQYLRFCGEWRPLQYLRFCQNMSSSSIDKDETELHFEKEKFVKIMMSIYVNWCVVKHMVSSASNPI